MRFERIDRLQNNHKIEDWERLRGIDETMEVSKWRWTYWERNEKDEVKQSSNCLPLEDWEPQLLWIASMDWNRAVEQFPIDWTRRLQLCAGQFPTLSIAK